MYYNKLSYSAQRSNDITLKIFLHVFIDENAKEKKTTTVPHLMNHAHCFKYGCWHPHIFCTIHFWNLMFWLRTFYIKCSIENINCRGRYHAYRQIHLYLHIICSKPLFIATLFIFSVEYISLLCDYSKIYSLLKSVLQNMFQYHLNVKDSIITSVRNVSCRV